MRTTCPSKRPRWFNTNKAVMSNTVTKKDIDIQKTNTEMEEVFISKYIMINMLNSSNEGRDGQNG